MGKYFGTDGFRGEAGSVLTVHHAFKIGVFLGSKNNRRNKILLAEDTRISSNMLTAALIAGINSSGSDVYLLGISSTPSISYLVIQKKYDFGIMVSASHNPFFDNGIKIFDSNGIKLCENSEKEIEQYIDETVKIIPDKVGKDIGKTYSVKELQDEYLNFLASRVEEDLSKFHLLVDCANGATSFLAPKLFKKLGLKADFINTEPNGININDRSGSTHLNILIKKVKDNGYHLGMAFDGDGDRFLAVDHGGNIIDGDLIIYLLALHYQKKGLLKGNTVVVTHMSNYGLPFILNKHGIEVMRTEVGDKYVQAELEKHQFTIGGEQSGHIIFHDDLLTGDGMLTAIKLLNVYAASKKSIAEINLEYTRFPQELKNVKVVRKKDVLDHPGLIQLLKLKETELKDHGRIYVRPSGTEPLIRVMVEDQDAQLCKEIVEEIAQFITDLGY